MRVVSLIASATEIVAALGCRDSLVAVSHECDFPPSVEGLPRVTEPKFDVSGTSAEIDRRVKEVLRDALAVYWVDAVRLKALEPDVIVTQDQCEVCAVSLADVEQAVCDWTGSDLRVVSLRPDSLADLWRDIRSVAAALDREEAGERLVEELRSRMAEVADRARRLRTRPRVATIEWADPLMAGGNWVPELVEMAGGTNLFGEAGNHSPWMDWDGLAAADPDAIVLMPCGFGLPRVIEDVEMLSKRREWRGLRAVREGRVFATDGNQYFNRPGPRLAESLEILAEILHPEEFAFGHEGTGWIRVSEST